MEKFTMMPFSVLIKIMILLPYGSQYKPPVKNSDIIVNLCSVLPFHLVLVNIWSCWHTAR